MENAKVTKHRYEETKRIIDYIYTVTSNDYPHGAWTNESYNVKRIVTILIKRGVLIYVGKSKKRGVSYQWNQGAMAPTETFYKSIAQEIANTERSYRLKKMGDKTQAKTEPSNPALSETATAIKSKIVDFTAQELWNELKRRGYFIDGNKITCKLVLD